MFKNEFVKYEDKLYIVKKILKAEFNPDIPVWKEAVGADIALRRGDLIYFVELVPDLELVDELQ